MSHSERDKVNEVLVFTDGSCLGNPGPGGWGLVVVIQEEIHASGGGKNPTTNNEMELEAIEQALVFLKQKLFQEKLTKHDFKVHFYVDSQYVLRALLEWLPNWKKRGGLTQSGERVSHWELLLRIDHDLEPFQNLSCWHYVPGHRGVLGNEWANQLAQAWAGSYPQPPVINSIPSWTAKELRDSVAGVPDWTIGSIQKKPKLAGEYVVWTGNKLFFFSQWPDCEKFVKGQKGYLYKKYHSPQELIGIMRAWGVPQDEWPDHESV